MKTCLIIQPAGLGDIFFCQKIATHYSKNLGFKVIWPVYEHFLYIKDYIKNDGIPPAQTDRQTDRFKLFKTFLY